MPGRERRFVARRAGVAAAAAEHALRCRRAAAPPGRSSIGSPRQATMVDSRPTGVGPPSRIRSTRPSRSASTCCAVVGETWPERLAEGATIGLPNAASSVARDRMRPARAPRWCRGRRSQDRRPGSRAAFGSTSVSGPGQKAAASRSASHRTRASAPRRVGVRHMRDQRVEARPALGGIKPRDRLAVGGIGAEAVDRLGRERDEAARGQDARRGFDRIADRPPRRVWPAQPSCGLR